MTGKTETQEKIESNLIYPLVLSFYLLVSLFVSLSFCLIVYRFVQLSNCSCSRQCLCVPHEFHSSRLSILRQKYAGSTQLSSVRRILEAETGIPRFPSRTISRDGILRERRKDGAGVKREIQSLWMRWQLWRTPRWNGGRRR